MHRSASTSRASDEFFGSMSPPMKPSPGLRSVSADQLPTYDPLSDISKKETSRLRAYENAVHAIPAVLLVCAIILWLFSHPVDVVNKDGSIVARIKGLSPDAYANHTKSPALKESGRLDIHRQTEAKEAQISSEIIRGR